MTVKRRRVERGGGEEKEDDPLELKLYRDPWVVKKKLMASDLDHLSRVILPRVQVEKHVLPFLKPSELYGVLESVRGLNVWVNDLDTETSHLVSLRQWKSNRSYKLGLNWISAFVKRRELRTGDVIGMLWDNSTRVFYFSVLERSPPPPPPPPPPSSDGAAAEEPVLVVTATTPPPPPPDPYLCEYARKRLCLSPPEPEDTI